MQELQQAVANAFANVVSAGTIEKAIEEKLSKTITSIIDEELRSYSDFGKSLSEQVKSAMQVDFRNLGLPGYNDLILKVIRDQVEHQTSNSIAAHVAEQIKELLAPAPAQIKLSELIQEFIKFAADDIGCSCDKPEQITLIVNDGSDGGRYSSLSGYHHIYFDKESGKDKWECDFQIDVDGDGKVYGVRLDKRDPSKTIFIGRIHGFSRRVYQLYAAGTKLIIDGGEDDINTYYPGYDD